MARPLISNSNAMGCEHSDRCVLTTSYELKKAMTSWSRTSWYFSGKLQQVTGCSMIFEMKFVSSDFRITPLFISRQLFSQLKLGRPKNSGIALVWYAQRLDSGKWLSVLCRPSATLMRHAHPQREKFLGLAMMTGNDKVTTTESLERN